MNVSSSSFIWLFFNLIKASDPLKIDSIIKLNEFTEETFIVKDLLGDMLVCVSTTETNIANPQRHYFKKDSVIFVENKQKRK